MKRELIIFRNALVILLLSASILTIGQDKKLPNVVILATGKTSQCSDSCHRRNDCRRRRQFNRIGLHIRAG
jgi:hypothetical protein